MADPTHHCPTCGHEVTIMKIDEHESWWVPVAPGADGDAINMAIAIRSALKLLGKGEPGIAAAALRGVLAAHETRLARKP